MLRKSWFCLIVLLFVLFLFVCLFVFFLNTGTCRSWKVEDHCFNISERNYTGVPEENITITVRPLGTTGRFYVNISWIPPPGNFNLLYTS